MGGAERTADRDPPSAAARETSFLGGFLGVSWECGLSACSGAVGPACAGLCGGRVCARVCAHVCAGGCVCTCVRVSLWRCSAPGSVRAGSRRSHPAPLH